MLLLTAGGEDTNPTNVLDYERLAQRRLAKPFYDFIAGGAEDETTVHANREAFQRFRLRPRFLVDVSTVSTATSVLGQRLELPVMLAPVALQKLAHPDGEMASARAAAAAGTVQVLSTVSSCTLEDVARAAAAPRWFQLYCYDDMSISEGLIRRAEASGYSAVCVTVDVPRLGRRERDLRNSLEFPADVFPANLVEYEAQPSAVATVPDAAALAALGPEFRSLTWDDVDRLSSLTSLPVVLKGIMTAEDARLAVEHGVRAVVVSNHGGRQLDGEAATLTQLPEVVDAVAGRAEVLMDGGVRRGTDVLKALALGAKAVLIGRPYIWGLAVHGEAGVLRVLAMLKEELEVAMAQAGRPSVDSIDRSLVTGLESASA